MTRETNMTLIRDALKAVEDAIEAMKVAKAQESQQRAETLYVMARVHLNNARSFLRTVSI